MKHAFFTTRLRAEEITKEAIKVWEQSFQSEKLEKMDQDPVFSLFINALAYQANEIDAEIDQLKSDIQKEFAQMLVPFDMLHALPATAVIEAQLDEQVAEKELNSDSVFMLQDSSYGFIPLLKSKLFNCNVTSIARLDNRRWKVSIDFLEPVKSLAGMTFMISNSCFRDVKVTMKGQPLPLIKPWEYADLPLSRCFSIENMIYTKSSAYDATSVWFDLFAKQNIRLFCVDSYKMANGTQNSKNKLELIFEFFGITDDFYLDKEQLFLNAVVLVNATKSAVTLSPSSPIARIGGETNQHILHVLCPSETQTLSEEPISIRKVAINRFNAERLRELVNTLVYRYHSDFYAFQDARLLRDGQLMNQIDAYIKRLADNLDEMNKESSETFFVSLNRTSIQQESKSLRVEYLTTNGTAVNNQLTNSSVFYTPSFEYIKSTRTIANPVMGLDTIHGVDAENSIAKYYMVTGNRIVTPADIKIFCYNELLTHYSINSDLISSIRVKNRRTTDRTQCGFETVVYISVKDNLYVRKSFEKEIPSAELILQKMIEVRSTNVLPVQVSIEIS